MRVPPGNRDSWVSHYTEGEKNRKTADVSGSRLQAWEKAERKALTGELVALCVFKHPHISHVLRAHTFEIFSKMR